MPVNLHPRPKKRVKIKLHADETIVNQIAYYAVKHSGSISELKDFISETDKCTNIDSLLRVILSRYEVEVEE